MIKMAVFEKSIDTIGNYIKSELMMEATNREMDEKVAKTPIRLLPSILF